MKTTKAVDLFLTTYPPPVWSDGKVAAAASFRCCHHCCCRRSLPSLLLPTCLCSCAAAACAAAAAAATAAAAARLPPQLLPHVSVTSAPQPPPPGPFSRLSVLQTLQGFACKCPLIATCLWPKPCVSPCTVEPVCPVKPKACPPKPCLVEPCEAAEPCPTYGECCWWSRSGPRHRQYGKVYGALDKLWRH
mgnify:CR=1 FL=1